MLIKYILSARAFSCVKAAVNSSFKLNNSPALFKQLFIYDTRPFFFVQLPLTFSAIEVCNCMLLMKIKQNVVIIDPARSCSGYSLFTILQFICLLL